MWKNQKAPLKNCSSRRAHFLVLSGPIVGGRRKSVRNRLPKLRTFHHLLVLYWGHPMKRYCFRIGVLGIVVVLSWIAVAYAQRGSNEAAGNNPLRNPPLQPSSDRLDAIPEETQPPADDSTEMIRQRERPEPLRPAADSIPDAAAVEMPTVEDHRPGSLEDVSAAAPADAEGPSLLAPPAPQQVGRNAAATPKSAPKAADRSGNTRSTGPRAASENEEPAPFRADPFGEPTALPAAKAGNPPATRTNPSARNPIRTTATSPDDDAAYTGPAANAMAPGNANNTLTPYNSSIPTGPVGQLNPVVQNNPPEPLNPVSEGTGQPGAKQLEGPQSPQVMIQKVAPPEVQVGRPAVFKTLVRNTGSIPASQVEVRDMIPKGTKLLNTTPRAQQGPRGEIVWTLGTLRPGEESAVEMELMPTAEGEIGSVATVHFGADASAKTISTRPDIVVQTTAPAQAMIGEKFNMQITVSNPGTGVATGVVIEEHLPAGLHFPEVPNEPELVQKIGTLKPGETKKLDLELLAATAGPVTNLLSVRADGNLRKEDRLQMEVVAPKLDIALEGPKKRYLERQATYQVSVMNPGTAPAQGVELAAYLPAGMKFVSANNQGHYDEATRAVYWRLEQLPTRDSGTCELVTLPVEAGQQSIKLRGSAQKVQAVEKEQPVIVEGIAAVSFHVVDSVDPVEVGGETTYEVKVMNQGSKAASNVQLMATIPQEMQPLSADGPTRYGVQGNNVIFEGLARLAPKAETTYHVRVKGNRPGDLHVRFQLKTDEMQSPVTKEESTQVYADE